MQSQSTEIYSKITHLVLIVKEVVKSRNDLKIILKKKSVKGISLRKRGNDYKFCKGYCQQKIVLEQGSYLKML